MKVFIVRHAIAEERGNTVYEHDDRPLSKSGIRKMTANANGIARIISQPIRIISSPLKRAYGTAEILSSQLQRPASISISSALSPETSAESIVQLCKKYSPDDSILIVGHEPSLGKFISTILQQKTQMLKLKKGSLCCVKFNPEIPKQSELLFYLPPRILRMVS